MEHNWKFRWSNRNISGEEVNKIMTEGLIDAPEYYMNLEELLREVENLAERKLELAHELMNIDSKISQISAIATIKAMEELKTRGNNDRWF